MFHVPAQMSSDCALDFRGRQEPTSVCELSPFTAFSRRGFSFARRAETAAVWCILRSFGCGGEGK